MHVVSSRKANKKNQSGIENKLIELIKSNAKHTRLTQKHENRGKGTENRLDKCERDSGIVD